MRYGQCINGIAKYNKEMTTHAVFEHFQLELHASVYVIKLAEEGFWRNKKKEGNASLQVHAGCIEKVKMH